MWDGRIGTKKSRRRLNKEIVFATTVMRWDHVDAVVSLANELLERTLRLVDQMSNQMISIGVGPVVVDVQ